MVVFSRTEAEHLQTVERVFDIFQQNNLKLKLEKCKLLAQEVDLLGHLRQMACRQARKLELVRGWPIPRNASDILSFLCFCGFYRWCVPRAGQLAGPLYAAATKEFDWTP